MVASEQWLQTGSSWAGTATGLSSGAGVESWLKWALERIHRLQRIHGLECSLDRIHGLEWSLGRIYGLERALMRSTAISEGSGVVAILDEDSSVVAMIKLTVRSASASAGAAAGGKSYLARLNREMSTRFDILMDIYKLKLVFGDTDEVESVSVIMGESVTLNTGVPRTHDDLIEWRFNSIRIAIANILEYDNDERFRDRLKLDPQTGSLTITNTRTTDSGEYKLSIIVGNKDIIKRFNVTVYSE
ncbi:hypothetical protein DPX16_4819 [Anabarilius grahami]|uniref:Immunoglobulin domain-containing protein n=1 Tax=Anabarilius grahami TaxID=495550 RepID=A0A3N0ZAE5_ANAGA|nr:hypothetical protein DPX16_4819 [Anabarilius grahami]